MSRKRPGSKPATVPIPSNQPEKAWQPQLDRFGAVVRSALSFALWPRPIAAPPMAGGRFHDDEARRHLASERKLLLDE